MGDDVAVRRIRVFASLHGYQRRAWVSADLVAGIMLLVIAVPEQLATSRLAGMPPITGFYAFVAGTVVYAILGSNPQMSVGADSTIAPLFATGVSALALTGSEHYVALVGILAVMVGLIVMLVSVLRLGWIAEFFVDAHRDRLFVRRGSDHRDSPAARSPRSAANGGVECASGGFHLHRP